MPSATGPAALQGEGRGRGPLSWQPVDTEEATWAPLEPRGLTKLGPDPQLQQKPLVQAATTGRAELLGPGARPCVCGGPVSCCHHSLREHRCHQLGLVFLSSGRPGFLWAWQFGSVSGRF